MSFTLSVQIGANAATGVYGGQVANAYKASRFGSAPTTNTAAPGGGVDYGPSTTTTTQAAGLFTTTTFELFYVSYYDPADTSNSGTYNVYWIGPFLPVNPTNSQGWTAAADQTANRLAVTTSIASGSNGATLPQSTINVGSTSGFPSSGYIGIRRTIANGGNLAIPYTGTTSTTFTGCTGGSGALATGEAVFVAYMNGSSRRLALITIEYKVMTTGDESQVFADSTVAGTFYEVANSGVSVYNGTTTITLPQQLTIPVDPNGFYGVHPVLSGTGAIFLDAWLEVDF